MENFIPGFIEQAKFYALADKHGIGSLCQLGLFKLHKILKSFKLYLPGVGGIIEFVRFVYSNTPPDYGDNHDALRNVVARYIVSVPGKIGEEEAFKKLLEEGGDLVRDFWNIMLSLDDNSG